LSRARVLAFLLIQPFGHVGRRGAKSSGRTTMRRAWLLLAGMALAPLSVLAQTMDFSKVEILTEKLGPNVYMLSGSSGLDPAREELRESMVQLSKAPNASSNPVANPAGFPVITYGMGDPLRIYMNSEVVQFIPIRAAHTSGDTNIKFEKANVLFIGDFYRNYG